MRRGGSLCGFLLIALSASVSGASIISDIHITLERRGDEAVVILRNSPNELTVIAMPLVEWRPGTTGVEFKIWNRKGDAVIECVARDYPSSFQKRYALKPGEKISKYFKMEQIRKDFCINDGIYFMQAIFHNETFGKNGIKDVISNPVEVEWKKEDDRNEILRNTGQ